VRLYDLNSSSNLQDSSSTSCILFCSTTLWTFESQRRRAWTGAALRVHDQLCHL
jgi:hypothetical protein